MAKLLFDLTVPNDVRALPVVGAALGASTSTLGFEREAALRLQMAVEEACLNVIEHAYLPSERETFRVEAALERGRLRVRVADHGLPFDPLGVSRYDPDDPSTRGLGTFLMTESVDEIRHVNLGREGKAVDILEPLPRGGDEPALSIRAPSPLGAPPSGELTIRRFRPEDAPEVARCAYQVYGYSYSMEHVYVPDRLAELNESDEVMSIVAVDDRGAVYGHGALSPVLGTPLGEIGQVFSMPAVRGRGVMKSMMRALVELGRAKGMKGLIGEAVAIHPYSQQGTASVGFRECGMLLGYVPEIAQFKAIGTARGRQTAVLVFQALEPLAPRVVYTPPHRRDLVARIYDHLGVAAEIRAADARASHERPARASEAQIRFAWSQSQGIGAIAVEAYGEGLLPQIMKRLTQLKLRQTGFIHLDLPMDRPEAASAAAEVERLGFVPAGIVPWYFGEADALRYQFINNVPVARAAVKLASDFSRSLFEYVWRAFDVPPEVPEDEGTRLR